MKITEMIGAKEQEIQAYGRKMNINPLVVEDCISKSQRSKFEDYGDHQYIVWVMQLNNINIEFHFILFENEITIMTDSSPIKGDTWCEYLQLNKVHEPNNHFLYYFIDRLMDLLEEQIKPYSHKIKNMEDIILNGQIELKVLVRLKWRISEFAFILSSLPGVVENWKSHLGPKSDLKWRLRDLLDHTIRLQKMVDFSRILTSDAITTYWGMSSKKTNDQMKRLTLLACIFLPINFWTSFWGMNFPEIPWSNKIFFAYAFVVMFISPLAVFWILKKKGYFKDD